MRKCAPGRAGDGGGFRNVVGSLGRGNVTDRRRIAAEVRALPVT
jgi:hypothetical protein